MSAATMTSTDTDAPVEWTWQGAEVPPPTGTPLEYAAAWYCRHGLHVVPLVGKNPSSYGDDWWTRAISDPLEALVVFSDTRFTNVGWCQGYGTVAVDVDDPDHLCDDVRSVVRRGAANNTRPSRRHRIFATSELWSASTARFPCQGWGEVRAHGGQVVIWGPHPDDPAAHYCYDATQDVPDAPAELLEWLTPRGDYAEAATDEEVDRFLAEHTESANRTALNMVFSWADDQVAEGASLHELTAKRLGPWLMREARAGLYPGQEAHDRLKEWWTQQWTQREGHPADANGVRQRTKPAKREFAGIMSWAVAQAAAATDDDIAKVRAKNTVEWVDETKTCTSEVEVPAEVDDAHMGAAFAASLVGRYLYVAAWRRWLRWDGRRWADDDTEAVHEEARRWVLRLGALALEVGAHPDVVRRIAGYRSRARLDAITTLARRMHGVAARADEFDAHPDLLCVANGVVDLRNGALAEHDPALRLRKLANVHYGPAARHADVDAVLAVVDDDPRAWLHRFFGYAATGHTHEDVVGVFDGDGANGKTTLLEAVAAALGDHAGAAPAKLVMRTNNDEHPTIKADLLGRRLVWISETEEGGSLRMEQLKALTGGDRIKARFMRADYFEFQPTHTLVLATNHRPYVNSTEHAAWRRLRLVPFPHTYRSSDDAGPGDRVRDPRLRHRLRTGSAQRSAMLAWIVTGAVEWHRDGLGESDTITAATDAWRRSEDIVARFIDETLELGVDAQVRGRDLYTAYRDWCDAEGRRPKSNKNFVTDFMAHEMVLEAGVEVVRPQGQAHYRGVQIRATAPF